MALTVRNIAARETHDLRRRVLRDGDAVAALDWPGDHAARTVHLGAFTKQQGASTSDSRLVGVSTWLVEPDPRAPDVSAVQLRGMATAPDMTSRGIATMLLDAGQDHARSIGAERVWANARVTALGFYERAGFTVHGEVFLTPSTGLPHRHVHILTTP